MRLALDTSALLTIFNQEPGAEPWMEALIIDAGLRQQPGDC